jgi:hypothetical protein
MARWVHMTVAFAVLAAWAGAQSPAPPALSPEDKLRLLKANGPLIGELVHEGVAMSAAGDPVQRAERCRGAARSLANAIEDAARQENPDRVAELAGLFRDLVRDGLVPTIEDAQRGVPPESPSGRRLRDLRGTAAKDVSDLKAAVAAPGTLGDNPLIKDVRKQLDELADALK